MISVNIEHKIAEQFLDAIDMKLDSLAKVITTCLKAKQNDAVTLIKQDIAAFNALKSEIEDKLSGK